ncbi:MAG: hypothetical protein GC179_22335 [Anaerolineaceae bacterium]|nr:hypothetical protein [Anaerolineaceae bacterium]
MLLGSLNAIFAVAAFFLARRGLERGWPFIKIGWQAIQSQAEHADIRENVFRRLTASEGGRFFLGGIGWLSVSILAFLAGIYFTIVAYQTLFSGVTT